MTCRNQHQRADHVPHKHEREQDAHIGLNLIGDQAQVMTPASVMLTSATTLPVNCTAP
jgi:hypothetical protein